MGAPINPQKDINKNVRDILTITERSVIQNMALVLPITRIIISKVETLDKRPNE